MVRAGPMRHLVRFEERISTQDAAGEPGVMWMLVASRWAAIQRTPGSELFSAAQRQGRVPTIFRLRYPSDLPAPIGPHLRLVYDGRVYDILSAIDEAGLREELVVTAEERLREAP